MNAFAPIFYVAFFKGRCVHVWFFFIWFFTSAQPFFYPLFPPVLPSFRFAGRPGDYFYVFGDYRMEEVGFFAHICGCLYKYVQ